MIRMLLIFILFSGSIWLGLQLHHDTGYVLISLNHWTIEATVLTMLLTLLIIFFVLHVTLITLNWFLDIPRRWRYFQLKRKTKKALKAEKNQKIEALKRKLSFETTPEGYFAIGQLLESLDDKAGASIAYREGLRNMLKL